MTPDFDVIIVGSGPAGVSAAFPLVEVGRRVLMVDGGRQSGVAPPQQPFLSARAQSADQWKWMIGEDFNALKNSVAVSPKLRAPTHAYVFEGFSTLNRIDAPEFVALGSLATGGLSNAWGCGVARLSPRELSGFPVDVSQFERSYESVSRRIGISGRHDDDMADYFGVDAWSQPAIEMDALHNRLYGSYGKRRDSLASLGFRMGRSRVAVLSEDRAERKACDRSGNCLWGCRRGALYTAADELARLRLYENFSLHSGFVVERIVRNGSNWSVEGCSTGLQQRQAISARKVLLAAGTLATTRLALQALKLQMPVPLQSCPTAAFLLWLPRSLGAERTRAFGLGQLSFALTLPDATTAFGSTFSTTGIPVSEFLRHLPLRRRAGVDVLGGLLSSCLVGNLFLPGRLSSARVSLSSGDQPSLRIEGGYSDRVPAVMAEAARSLRRAYRQLGAVMLPMSFTVGRAGSDIHYAGTLPMRAAPLPGETNSLGELHGLDGVHVVDGACLPTLSEKSHTLTIMANADRIGRALGLGKP